MGVSPRVRARGPITVLLVDTHPRVNEEHKLDKVGFVGKTWGLSERCIQGFMGETQDCLSSLCPPPFF